MAAIDYEMEGRAMLQRLDGSARELKNVFDLVCCSRDDFSIFSAIAYFVVKVFSMGFGERRVKKIKLMLK